jgi:hypothetical protein
MWPSGFVTVSGFGGRIARPPGAAGVCVGGAPCAPNHAVPASAIATIHGPVFVMVHLDTERICPFAGHRTNGARRPADVA